MNRTKLVASLAAVLCSSAALAQQTGNPAGAAPETPGLNNANPAADYPNTQDKLFARQADMGGRAEVSLGKLALSKGHSEAVKNFAKRMVDDHGQSNTRLSKLAQAHKAELSKDLDPDQKQIQDELAKKQGADFDTAYLQAQVHDHQVTAHLLEWEIGSGESAAMKKYAADTLPTVLEHLQMAKMDLANLTMAPPPR